MRRADRLFQIIELLRNRRLTTAQFLADKLEVSVRTVYRDIADLQLSGVDIEGEAGLGYQIRHYDLAPLMFNSGELEAIISGIKLAKAWMDDELKVDADSALLKIEKILPAILKKQFKENTLVAPDFHVPEKLVLPMATLRKAINERRKVAIEYSDVKEAQSHRVIRPLGLIFWGQTWTLVAWCELRNDFRNFRLDRFDRFKLLIDKFEQQPGETLQDYINQYKE